MRLTRTGSSASSVRTAFDPIAVWNFVKARDDSGQIFATEQFAWLFSTAFRRNADAVQQTVAMLSSNPNPVGAEAYSRQANAYLKHDALDRLHQIKSKTLVITGEQDLLTPPWIGRELAQAIPGARFELITGDGSSHVVPLERPDDFNRLVTDFLLA